MRDGLGGDRVGARAQLAQRRAALEIVVERAEAPVEHGLDLHVDPAERRDHREPGQRRHRRVERGRRVAHDDVDHDLVDPDRHVVRERRRREQLVFGERRPQARALVGFARQRAQHAVEQDHQRHQLAEAEAEEIAGGAGVEAGAEDALERDRRDQAQRRAEAERVEHGHRRRHAAADREHQPLRADDHRHQRARGRDQQRHAQHQHRHSRRRPRSRPASRPARGAAAPGCCRDADRTGDRRCSATPRRAPAPTARR